MSTEAYLNAPFSQPSTTATPVLTSPLAMPQAPGQDDAVIMFMSTMRRVYGDGAHLAMVLPRMAARHPGVAAEVIVMGNLGPESVGRAVESLRIYDRTGVAIAPRRV